MSLSLAVAGALGAVIGVLLGLLGSGGSILAVPVLVYLLAVPIDQAIPMSLIVVATAAAVAALSKARAGQVQWRLAVIFVAAGVPAALLGTLLGRRLPEALILIGFAIVLMVAGFQMLRDPADTGTACATGDSGINWRRCAPRSLAAGLLVGVLTGLFGVGGGFLIIPALVLLLGVGMSVAIGTSLVIITANSLAGIASHVGGTTIDWLITAVFAGAAIVGSLIAGQLGTAVKTERLQRLFTYLLFAVALYMLVDTIFIR